MFESWMEDSDSGFRKYYTSIFQVTMGLPNHNILKDMDKMYD